MQTIGAVVQGMGEGEQILHNLAALQRLNLNRLKGNVGMLAPQFGNQRSQMLFRAHQHGDFFVWIGFLFVLNNLHNRVRLALAGSFCRFIGLLNNGVNLNARIIFSRFCCNKRAVRYRALRVVVMRRENLCKSSINPIHYGWAGAIIAV